MYKIEIHTKVYGITKSKDPNKDGKSIGLQTRLIIHPLSGALTIKNFDYQVEAINYIKENYGTLRDGKYMIISNYKRYGERGYRW